MPKGNLWVLHLELTTADHLEIAKECLTEMLLGSLMEHQTDSVMAFEK